MGNIENVKKRRGIIKISKQLIEDADFKVLKALFSVFYPVAISNEHDFGLNSITCYYGYSEYFEEIEESEKTPQYLINFVSHQINKSKYIVVVESIAKI